VIEIDSAPNSAPAEKLVFARDAGAFPLWVRFRKGGIEKINGMMVLDVRDAVRVSLMQGNVRTVILINDRM